jgi:hypothetical protein
VPIFKSAEEYSDSLDNLESSSSLRNSLFIEANNLEEIKETLERAKDISWVVLSLKNRLEKEYHFDFWDAARRHIFKLTDILMSLKHYSFPYIGSFNRLNRAKFDKLKRRFVNKLINLNIENYSSVNAKEIENLILEFAKFISALIQEISEKSLVGYRYFLESELANIEGVHRECAIDIFQYNPSIRNIEPAALKRLATLQYSTITDENNNSLAFDVDDAIDFATLMPNFFVALNSNATYTHNRFSFTDQVKKITEVRGDQYAKLLDRLALEYSQIFHIEKTASSSHLPLDSFMNRVFVQSTNDTGGYDPENAYEKLEKSMNKFDSTEDFIICSIDERFAKFSTQQKENIKTIIKNFIWEPQSNIIIEKVMNILPRIQDPEAFVEFFKGKSGEYIIRLLESSINSGQKVISPPIPPNVNIDPHKSADNVEEFFKLVDNVYKSYDDPEIRKVMLFQQHELMSLLKGKVSSLAFIIANNYKMVDSLKDKIEKYTRKKQGTPEYEKMLSIVLLSEQFLAVNPQNYDDFLTLITATNQVSKLDQLVAKGNQQSALYLEDLKNIAKILAWFKDDWRKALTIFSQKEKKFNISDAIHNLGNTLPDKVKKTTEARVAPPDMRNYFLSWSKRGDFDSLLNAIKLWDNVTKEDIANNPSPKELYIKILQRSKQFEGVKHPEFFLESIQHSGSIHPHTYLELERVFLQSQKIPLPKWTENIVVEEIGPKNKKYIGRFLPRSDVRGLYLGEYTGCCQHPGGLGASCAYHGQCSPYGAFFVVENEEGNIIAQSWVWEAKERKSKDGEILYAVVFDNIETKGAQGREEVIIHLYEKAAELMKADIVHIGEDYTKIDLSHLPKATHTDLYRKDLEPEEFENPQSGIKWEYDENAQNEKPGYLTPVDYDDYTDADETQRVLKHETVNRLPENKVFFSSEREPTENKAEPIPDWWLENPYSNLKKAMKMLQFAHFAESKGLIRLADKFIKVSMNYF